MRAASGAQLAVVPPTSRAPALSWPAPLEGASEDRAVEVRLGAAAAAEPWSGALPVDEICAPN